MISNNANASLGLVDCSPYTRRIALKDDYHRKRMDMLTSYTLVEFKYMETRADFYSSRKTNSVHPRKHFHQCSNFLKLLQFLTENHQHTQ